MRQCLIYLFVKILKVKAPVLNSVVLAFILIGSYAMDNSMFTVGLTIFFGMVGYLFKKLRIPSAPMVLASVLGYLTEQNLRQAMIICDENFFKVITRPITAVILVLAVLLAFGTPITAFLKTKFAGGRNG